MNKYLNIFILAGVLISTSLYPKDIVKDPITLETWLLKNFTYQSEKNDYWKTPEETIRDTGGDCEDFAFLVETILKDLGYEAQTIAIYGWQIKNKKKVKYYHAICIFKNNNQWQYFSNQYYYKWKTFNTVEEIINYDCPKWIWYSEIYQDIPNTALFKKWR